jgi:acyl-CoA thioesterase I
MKTASLISIMILLASAQTRNSGDSRPVILAFGDSLTAGYGVPPDAAYPTRLQRRLDERGLKYRVVGMGISGDTTSGGRARLKSAIDQKPSIVILELGANDGLRGSSIPQMQTNLENMIKDFQKAGAKVVLAGMTLPKNYGDAYVKSFETVFRDLAQKYDLSLIPFFLEGVAGNPKLTLEDLIHPNAEGYVRVTDIVMKTLEPLLKRAGAKD